MSEDPEDPPPTEMKGWDHLPPELKLQCMEGLSFKDLFGARSYCKFDRALVDETFKFEFKSVILEKDHLKFQVSEVSKDGEIQIPRIKDEEYKVDFNSENMTKVAPILAYILQNFKVEKLIYKESDQIFNDEFQKLLDSEKSINVKNLKFCHSKDLFQINPFFLLEKLRGTFEKAELDIDKDVVNMDSLFMIPAVIGAGIWTFSNVDSRQFVFLVENCAKHLMKIGTVIKTKIDFHDRNRNLVFERLQFKRIYVRDAPTNQVLIPTKHEDRQIFIAYHKEHLLAFVIAPGTKTKCLLEAFKTPEEAAKQEEIDERHRKIVERATEEYRAAQAGERPPVERRRFLRDIPPARREERHQRDLPQFRSHRSDPAMRLQRMIEQRNRAYDEHLERSLRAAERHLRDMDKEFAQDLDLEAGEGPAPREGPAEEDIITLD